MPDGKRREAVQEAVRTLLYRVLAGRILPFDSPSAPFYADAMASRRRAGRPMELPDAQIAAIALSRGFALATRNTEDFAGCGVKLINPWAG